MKQFIFAFVLSLASFSALASFSFVDSFDASANQSTGSFVGDPSGFPVGNADIYKETTKFGPFTLTVFWFYAELYCKIPSGGRPPSYNWDVFYVWGKAWKRADGGWGLNNPFPVPGSGQAAGSGTLNVDASGLFSQPGSLAFSGKATFPASFYPDDTDPTYAAWVAQLPDC